MEQLSLDFGSTTTLPAIKRWKNETPPVAKISSIISGKDTYLEIEASSTEDMIRRATDKEEEIQNLIGILRKDFPEVEMPLNHYFVGDLYAREIFMPAGSLVVGQIHLHDTISIISQGEALIFSSATGVKRVKAPMTFLSGAGTRRVLLILSDMVFSTVHITKERDPHKLREELAVGSVNELLTRLEN